MSRLKPSMGSSAAELISQTAPPRRTSGKRGVPRKRRSLYGDDMAGLRALVREFAGASGGRNQAVANVMHAVLSTANELHATLGLILAGADFSYGQLNVLFLLRTAPEHRLPLSKVAEKLYFSKANATHLIDSLLERGMVNRINDHLDRRLVYAELSEKGRAFMDWFAPLRCERAAQGMQNIPTSDLKKLVDLLDRLRAQTRVANDLRAGEREQPGPFQ